MVTVENKWEIFRKYLKNNALQTQLIDCGTNKRRDCKRYEVDDKRLKIIMARIFTNANWSEIFYFKYNK